MFGISKDDGKSIFLVVIGAAIAIMIAIPLAEWGKKKLEGVVK